MGAATWVGTKDFSQSGLWGDTAHIGYVYMSTSYSTPNGDWVSFAALFDTIHAIIMQGALYKTALTPDAWLVIPKWSGPWGYFMMINPTTGFQAPAATNFSGAQIPLRCLILGSKAE